MGHDNVNVGSKPNNLTVKQSHLLFEEICSRLCSLEKELHEVFCSSLICSSPSETLNDLEEEIINLKQATSLRIMVIYQSNKNCFTDIHSCYVKQLAEKNAD